MDEVRWAAADLPDPLVGVAPPLADAPHALAQERPQVGLDRAARSGPQVCRVQDLAVHVELELPRRGVSDPYRSGSAIPLEVVELDLGQQPLTADAVQDLEVVGPPGGGSGEPADEVLRLGRVAEELERVQRERRVSEPAIPVVPIPHTADVLGE